MSNFEQCTLDDVASALMKIDAHPREDWVRMGMAIKAEFGQDGFDTWNDWSDTASNYDAGAAKAVWKSFSNCGGAIGIGTLFQLAINEGWEPERREYTAEEKREYAKLQAERRAKREALAKLEQAAIEANYVLVAEAAQKVWAQVKWEGRSDYIERKKIDPCGVGFIAGAIVVEYVFTERTEFEELRQVNVLTGSQVKAFFERRTDETKFTYLTRGSIVLPLFNEHNQLMNVQVIYKDGSKKFLKCGRKSGCFFVIGQIDPQDFHTPITFLEGYATGASAFMATGWPCVGCLDAYNLPVVAKIFRRIYPQHLMLMAGDNDAQTDGNPGAAKAREAAQSVGGIDVVPDFSIAAANTDQPEVVNG